VIERADLVAGARLLRALPAFLRRPVSTEEALGTVRRRLEHRQRDFLELAARRIYGNPQSPYRALLAHAGCEYGDLAKLVTADGVEGALHALLDAGVYLTVEELKGRRPLVRGNTTLPFEPAHLGNPGSVVHLVALSGGSRSPGTPVPIDLASIREHAVNRRLALEARGGAGWRHAVWGVPGASELVIVLRFAASGATPVHWFSQLDPNTPQLHARYRWSARTVRWAGLGAGHRLPVPRHVPIDAPAPILDWMTGVLRAGATPHLKTFVSSAVRLCQAAQADGIDLTGVQLTVVGEPLTPARQAAIRSAGAAVLAEYGATETGQVAESCVTPAHVDDVHVLDDLQALIQPGAGHGRALPPKALLVTSLRTTAPLVLLNVSMGDQAELVRRECGCPMQRYGWGRHLHTVRSFEKLTSEGMTVLDVDVIRLLEEALPARFGGTGSDYQLVEDTSSDGRARLRLLVDPRLGALDTAPIVDAFLEGVAGIAEAQRLMTLLWRQAGLPTIERRSPYRTPSGKVLHVHQLTARPARATARASAG
jgi:hypothetical protein